MKSALKFPSLLSLFLFLTAPLLVSPAQAAQELQLDQLVPEALSVIFSGQERLRYEVSWSAGVKIGEVDMEIVPGDDGTHVIRARVVSSGALESFYPVNDTFECVVSGPLKLPGCTRWSRSRARSAKKPPG